MQIAKVTTKRTKRPAKIAQVFETMYAAARDTKDTWSFVTLTDLGIDFGLRQPAAEASSVSNALLELRHIDGMDELKRTLEGELRALQQAAQKHFGSFGILLALRAARYGRK